METRLCDIRPGEIDLTIRARVCRLWRGKIFIKIKRKDGLQCVLVDRNNNAIHATVSEADYDDIKDRIQLGHIYEITNFHATNNEKMYIVVPHEAQLLFNNRTQFVPLPEVYPPYPTYWFQFMEYSLLHKCKGKDEILTDVIGRVDSVHEVEDVPLGAIMAPKRSIDLQDLRGDNLTVNLWGSMGVEFNVSAIQNAIYPVVMVFTSTKVRTFSNQINVNSGMSTCFFINPSIPETEEYIRRFQGPAYAPKILKNEQRRKQRPPFDLKTAEIISVKTLNMKRTSAERDGQSKDTKGKSFLIKGEITKIMCRGDWYYMGCPRCLKQMKVINDPNTLECDTHDGVSAKPMYKMQVRVEYESDSVTLMALGKGGEYLFGKTCKEVFDEEGEIQRESPPPSLMKMMGETRLIEVVHGSRNDYLIKSVHGEDAITKTQSAGLTTPEKFPSKRSLKIQSDELAGQVPAKKQRGPSDEQVKQKMKNIDSLDKDVSMGHRKKALQISDGEASEEDEDLSLSQLFNQQLLAKKSSGQASKALVIGKKTSESLKNKKRSKME